VRCLTVFHHYCNHLRYLIYKNISHSIVSVGSVVISESGEL